MPCSNSFLHKTVFFLCHWLLKLNNGWYGTASCIILNNNPCWSEHAFNKEGATSNAAKTAPHTTCALTIIAELSCLALASSSPRSDFNSSLRFISLDFSCSLAEKNGELANALINSYQSSTWCYSMWIIMTDIKVTNKYIRQRTS